MRILLLLIVLLLIILLLCNKSNFSNNSRKAIVVLTRGYHNKSGYKRLISRNKSISKNLNDKSIDIVIYHEGNIQNEHQIYIMEQTPELEMTFVNVNDGNAFRKEKESIPNKIKSSNRWAHQTGYKHMCHFWFVDFWHYVEDYDIILRIDEDCMMKSNIDSILNKLSSKSIVYGKWWVRDEDYVTIDLRQTTNNFLQNNNMKPITDTNIGGPYTNVIGFNLGILRNNNLLEEYIKYIDKTDNIYAYRWGDLPLWGEVIKGNIVNNSLVFKDTKIKYYHGSHLSDVN